MPSRYTPKVRSYEVKPPPLRVSTRAWKPAALLDAVRKEIIALRDGPRDSYSRGYVKAEALAAKLRAKKSMITTALQRLIEEGLIGHKSGPAKWDQKSHDAEARGPNTSRKYRECWFASVFVILPVDR